MELVLELPNEAFIFPDAPTDEINLGDIQAVAAGTFGQLSDDNFYLLNNGSDINFVNGRINIDITYTNNSTTDIPAELEVALIEGGIIDSTLNQTFTFEANHTSENITITLDSINFNFRNTDFIRFSLNGTNTSTEDYYF